MVELLIILWLPATIAFMAVAFVVTLGAAGGPRAVESTRLSQSDANSSRTGVQ